MAVPNPMQTEFGIHQRLESCVLFPTYRLAGADVQRGGHQNGKPLCQASVGAATLGSPTPAGTLQTMEKLSRATPLCQQVCSLGTNFGVNSNVPSS